MVVGGAACAYAPATQKNRQATPCIEALASKKTWLMITVATLHLQPQTIFLRTERNQSLGPVVPSLGVEWDE